MCQGLGPTKNDEISDRQFSGGLSLDENEDEKLGNHLGARLRLGNLVKHLLHTDIAPAWFPDGSSMLRALECNIL